STEPSRNLRRVVKRSDLPSFWRPKKNWGREEILPCPTIGVTDYVRRCAQKPRPLPARKSYRPNPPKPPSTVPVLGSRVKLPEFSGRSKLNMLLIGLAMVSKEPAPSRLPPSQLSSTNRRTEV